MKRFLIAAIIALCALVPKGSEQAIAAATLLPNGEQCFQANTGTTGMVGALGTITGGSGGTTGTYGGVALTGGAGSGATANITVAGGTVTAVTILNPGTAYVVGDVLSAAAANIGSTTGFSVPVNSISINSALAGGSVTFYVPNTLTYKQTWSDQAQTTQNTNPVVLDQNGCMVAYGTGSYRQVVKDSLGNTVWDKLTTDTSANNNTFWAGLSAGTPNVITVVDPGFNGTDGSIIQFIANQTNTGPATLNPSGYGAIPIQKDTTAGPVALSGSEIVQNNIISVAFSATSGSFQLLNTVIASASGASAPLCGATGLTITNGGTPLSIISLTASNIVMLSTAGQVISRNGVSLTNINITLGNVTATANGMDGEAPGTSQWLYIWAIDNGAAAAGLVSTSATAPTMPSGYNSKCRLGAMRVDGSSNLYQSTQKGRQGQWLINASTGNTQTFPSIYNAANVAYTVAAVAVAAPATATQLCVRATNSVNISNWAIAPNATYSTSGGTQTPQLFVNNAVATAVFLSGCMVLESTNIYAYSNTGTLTVLGTQWTDSVNAN